MHVITANQVLCQSKRVNSDTDYVGMVLQVLDIRRFRCWHGKCRVIQCHLAHFLLLHQAYQPDGMRFASHAALELRMVAN